MFKLEGLEGRDFTWREWHCYRLLRDFHSLNFQMEMTDYANPEDWQQNGLSLFMDNYFKEGFEIYRGHPRDIKSGMVSLMAILSPVASHCGIMMPDGKILHHLVGQKSVIESYNRPIFRDNQVAILFHPGIDYDAFLAGDEIDAMDLLPAHLRKRLEDARDGV